MRRYLSWLDLPSRARHRYPDQTESQRLEPAFDIATDIVYGVVLKGARDGEMARFKIIHVYKGRLLAGQVIEAVPTYGFDPVPCLDFPYRPVAPKGAYGVVAFRQSPALNFIDERTLRLAFKEAGYAAHSTDASEAKVRNGSENGHSRSSPA